MLKPNSPRADRVAVPADMGHAARQALTRAADKPIQPRQAIWKVAADLALIVVLTFAACYFVSARPPTASGEVRGVWTESPVAARHMLYMQGRAADSLAILPRYRTVAFYGNPLSQKMGILGLVPPDSMFARLEREAAAYAASDPKTPVWPALHLVAVVAQPHAGDDGMYRLRMPADLIETVASWAEERDYLLFLDVQLGRSAVEAELNFLLPFLQRQYVHLALDPEFAMRSGQVPGEVIGSVDASDVNLAIEWLSDVVEKHRLPPKLLVIHRFTRRMLTGASEIRLHPNVQVVIDMDGIGSKEEKRISYRVNVRDEPVQFAGVKLFYRQDRPLLSPEEVLRLDPVPNVVIYQ